MVLGSTDVLLLLQRGYVDVGFMGGAQIDQYGNLNSSYIGDPANPKTRLPGTGGGNDIASLAQMIVAMKHEKRRFVEHRRLRHEPGLSARRARRAATRPARRRHVSRGRRISESSASTTTTKRMKIVALHPGVTARQVQDNTGFELAVAPDIAVDRAADRARTRRAAQTRSRPPLHGEPYVHTIRNSFPLAKVGMGVQTLRVTELSPPP